MLVWFATLASKKEIEARLDALEATVAAQNATIAALRDAISSRVAPPLRTGRHFKFIGRAGCCTYSSAAPMDIARREPPPAHDGQPHGEVAVT